MCGGAQPHESRTAARRRSPEHLVDTGDVSRAKTRHERRSGAPDSTSVVTALGRGSTAALARTNASCAAPRPADRPYAHVRERHRPRRTPQTFCSLSVSNIGARSRNWFRAAACIPISLLAVLVGLSVWGILGGLLAGPVTAALNVTPAVLSPVGAAAARATGRARGT